MSAPAKHRDTIIKSAITLFRRQGYSGTGIADIVSLAGAPKGSLYHFFPEGKASIARFAIGAAGKRGADTVQGLAKEVKSTGELMVAHATLMAGWMAKSQFRDGCPVTTVLLELAPLDVGVTSAGREALGLWKDVLIGRLQTDGFQPDRAARLAVLCIATLQGALIQTRVAKSRAPLLDAANELASLLDEARKN